MNSVGILITIFLIVLPSLGALWKKLEDKRERMRLQAERDRQREEELRTGRRTDASVAQPGQGASAADARKAQLEALRRAQQERLRLALAARMQQLQKAGSSPGGAAPAGPPIQRPTAPPAAARAPQVGSPPSHTQQTAAGRMPQVTAKARQAPALMARPAGTVTQARARQRLAVAKARPQAPEAPVEALADRMTRIEDAPAPAAVPKGKPAARPRGVPMSLADWRRAFIAQELLRPPLALRESLDQR